MLPTNPLLNATAPAGPHLPVALLRQYAAGTLAPAAQHRVEAHTLACGRCADILEGLLQTSPATTDQALAQLQQRLRQRVQQQAAPARLAQRPRRHHWLAPQLATAAALLLAMLAAGWWAWQQRQHTAAPVARTAQPRLVESPTPPPAPEAASPAAEVAVATPPAAASRPVATAPKRREPTAPLVAGRVATHSKKAPPAVSQPLTTPAAPVAAAADSAVLPAAVVAASPTPPSTLDKAIEPTARMRAAMPPPPVLAATPTGGYAALREYLKKEATNFEPETQDGPPRTGRVLVRLRIGADGKIEQAEAVRKLRRDYDAEAIRMLQEGPTWIPGISGGRRAAQTVDVPVEFE